MIDKLIHFSIKNKIIIGLFTLGLIIWGIYSLKKLPIDAVPDITNNQVQVITLAPTLAAQEVERSITYPVEVVMSILPDLVEIRSISRFGLSVVTIVFEDDVDIYHARQLVNERLKEAEAQIPANLGSPELAPVTTGLGEIYQYVLHTKEGYDTAYDAMELRTIQDWIVKRQLLGTPGVAEVSTLGGYLKQYEIAVDPDRLRSMNITMSDIFEALENNNENTGGAYIDKKPNAYFIRGVGLVTSLEDIENIVVKNDEGLPVLIRDVATARYGSAIRYGAMSRNGEGEVVGGIVMMLKGENSSDVIKNVKDKIETIQKSLPEGVVIEPFIDRTKLVNKAIGTVEKNLIEGGLIVIFILVLFLGNLRAGLVVASVIPLSMLFAISMMNLFGVSGNLMSLGAIDFGLIVDGAVIIVESIIHRITTNNKLHNVNNGLLTSEQMDDEVYNASVKIRQSAAFGEIIILIVYLPILTLVGIEGKMFRPMAQTVGFAILGALILSLTYVPMMSALFLSKKTTHKRNISDKMMDFFQRKYTPVIVSALNHKRKVILGAISIFIFSMIIFSRMGGEFIPTLEEGDFAINATIKSGSSISQTVETAQKMESILMKRFPEVTGVVSRMGAAEIPTDPMPVEANDMIVLLKEKHEWTSAKTAPELADKMKDALSDLPGVSFEFSQPIQLRFNELMTGVRSDIAIKIFGEDLDVLADVAEKASRIIQNTEGIGDLKVEQVKGLPQIIVQYDRAKMAQYGISVSDINDVIKTGFAGSAAGTVYEGEKRFDMVVRLENKNRSDIEDIKNLTITTSTGAPIPLSEVADVQLKEGPMQVSREDTKRRIVIGINVRNRDVQSLVEEVQQKLNEKLKLPPGYFITYGGQFENLIEARERLMIAVPAALGLILLLLFFTFGSMKQALLIFTAIPLSAIGGVFALWLRGMPFSISAGIGFIALFGVAVLNGIVLIGYLNQLKKEGMKDVHERILEGTRVRLRPVLMTAAVASLGFLPMALSGSAGAEVQKPLATVVIGGLISATLLTLIVLPVIYSWTEKDRKNKNNNNAAASTVLTIFLLCLICVPQKSKAQTNVNNNSGVPILSLQDAIQMGYSNNPSVKSASLETEQNRVLQGTGFDPSKTLISGQYGQFNSNYRDNSVSISQEFAFPGVYINNARLYKEQYVGSQYRLAVTRSELARSVKQIYYQLFYSIEKRKLYLYQDSIYSNFQKSAEISYKVGEGTFLEQTAAQARAVEIKNILFQTEADVKIYKDQLRKLINFTGDFEVLTDNSFYGLDIKIDTAAMKNNPYLAYFQQQVAISKAETRVEKSKLLPGFTLGVTSQTLQGFQRIGNDEQFFGVNDRFEFVSGGIGIPLFFGAQRSRINAAKLGEQIASSNYTYQKIMLESELQRLAQEYSKYKNTITYYENQGINYANQIVNYGSKSYMLGESGYFDYVQYLTQALQIRLNYIESLNEYNQTIIQLQYLLGDQNK